MEKVKKHWRFGVAVLLAFVLGWLFPRCGEGCEPAEVAEEFRSLLPQNDLALEAPASQPAPREPEPLRLLDPLGDDDAGDDTGRVIWTAEDGFDDDDDAEESSESPPPPPRSAGSEAENVSSGVQVSEGENSDDNLSGEEEAKAERAVPILPEPAPPPKPKVRTQWVRRNGVLVLTIGGMVSRLGPVDCTSVSSNINDGSGVIYFEACGDVKKKLEEEGKKLEEEVPVPSKKSK